MFHLSLGYFYVNHRLFSRPCLAPFQQSFTKTTFSPNLLVTACIYSSAELKQMCLSRVVQRKLLHHQKSWTVLQSAFWWAVVWKPSVLIDSFVARRDRCFLTLLSDRNTPRRKVQQNEKPSVSPKQHNWFGTFHAFQQFFHRVAPSGVGPPGSSDSIRHVI